MKTAPFKVPEAPSKVRSTSGVPGGLVGIVYPPELCSHGTCNKPETLGQGTLILDGIVSVKLRRECLTTLARQPSPQLRRMPQRIVPSKTLFLRLSLRQYVRCI